MTTNPLRDRVLAAFLGTQSPPHLVTWQAIAELAHAPVSTCQRIIRDADGHVFLLARDDSEGVMVAQSVEDAKQLTARLKRDVARLQQIAETKPLAGGELPSNS